MRDLFLFEPIPTRNRRRELSRSQSLSVFLSLSAGRVRTTIKISRMESFYQLIHGVKLESDRFAVGFT